MLHSLLALSALPAAFALEWVGPHATATASLPDDQGFTPKPTDGPRFNVVANANPGLKLFRRQGVSKYPNTCGYVDGNEEYSFTCPGANACGYNTKNFAFGCCSGTSTASNGDVFFTDPCYVDTTTTGCYASSEASSCTGTCTMNAEVCSKSTAPICRTVYQFGTATSDPITYTQYDCIPLGGRTIISLQDQYSFSSSITPNPLVDPSYSYNGVTFVPIASIGKNGTGSAATVTSPPAAGETDPLAAGGGGAKPKSANTKKNNTGAIAGGVVGGLAAVGLLAAGVIWALMRRKQKARRDAAAVNEVSHLTYMHEGK